MIVEFTDFQCPWCGQHYRTTLPRLVNEYINKGLVRYIVSDLPLPIHPHALPAAKLARCVGQLAPEAYWEVHNALFESQARLADSTIERIGTTSGVAQAPLRQCMSAAGTTTAIEDEVKAARGIGIAATPGFIIGPNHPSGRISGRMFQGAYPFEEFQAAIAAVLTRSGDGTAGGKGVRKL